MAGATTVDFNALTPGDQDVVAGIASYTSVNIFSCACSSTGDLLDDTTRGARAFAGGAFAIDFSQPLSYFGLYWGSPDPGNIIRIFNGGTELVSFTGTELLDMGVTEGLSGAAYVNFVAGPGERFTRVDQSSGVDKRRILFALSPGGSRHGSPQERRIAPPAPRQSPRATGRRDQSGVRGHWDRSGDRNRLRAPDAHGA